MARSLIMQQEDLDCIASIPLLTAIVKLMQGIQHSRGQKVHRSSEPCSTVELDSIWRAVEVVRGHGSG